VLVPSQVRRVKDMMEVVVLSMAMAVAQAVALGALAETVRVEIQA
jgi:hypothetical protein